MTAPILNPDECDVFGLEPEMPEHAAPMEFAVKTFTLHGARLLPPPPYDDGDEQGQAAHRIARDRAEQVLHDMVRGLQDLGLFAFWEDETYGPDGGGQVLPWIDVWGVLRPGADEAFAAFAAACAVGNWSFEGVLGDDDISNLYFRASDYEEEEEDDALHLAKQNAWAESVAIPREKMERLARQVASAKGNIGLCRRFASTSDFTRPGVSFLVEGLIPRGVVGLLAGQRTAGKSTACIHLALAISEGHTEWCGLPIPPAVRGSLTAVISGEDDEASNRDKLWRMNGGREPEKIALLSRDSRPIEKILDDLRSGGFGLAIVDPARKYVVGNEDSSGDVSAFFTHLETFAADTGATVLVVHHLRKAANPGSLEDVAQSIRGSGVFGDRPRFTLALCRRAGRTKLGIPAPDGTPLHRFDSEKMHKLAIALTFDAATLSLVPEAAEGAAREAKAELADTAAVDAVVAAIGRYGHEGQAVTRTGKKALFALGANEVAGISRAKITAAVDAAIRFGRLEFNSDSTLTVVVER